jgi:DNA-binding MarR family transcriptional regulator
MFERCIYFNTNVLARKLNAIWDEAFSEYELTPPQAYLLRLVLANPSMTQQTISQELQLNKSTVTRFVNQLEKKALLKRTASEGDQRENVIVPTQIALDLQESLEEQGNILYQTMRDNLGKQNLKAFVESARALNQKL